MWGGGLYPPHMAARSNIANSIEAGVHDPGLFPHRLSFDEGLVGFLPTSPDKLRAATFLDDRGDIAIGPSRLVAMDAVLRNAPEAAPPDRLIFHVSFCGSTLLSRLLDHPGKALVLREPQCLSDLAARRAALDQSGQSDPQVDAMIDCLPAWLARRWQADETVIVKPSNWANTLAPALCDGPRPVLPLFLVAGRRHFLRAVFRGGNDRIAFTARAAVHFSQAGRDNADRVARALAGDGSQEIKLARLAALAHRMQVELFDAARAGGGWGAERCLDFAELTADPIATAVRAARLLELDLPPDAITANADRWLSRDAKRPEAGYSDKTRQSEDDAVDAIFGEAIEAALDWVKDA